MRLTSILGEGLEDLGLYLEEEEDFIYLKQGDRTLFAWYAPSARIAQIRQIARKWADRYAKAADQCKQP